MSVSLTAAITRVLSWFGFEVRKAPRPGKLSIPDDEFYAPLFSPWRGYGEFAEYLKLAEPYTLVSPDRPIALAHVDVDIYRSVWDCCEFIYPRLQVGGAMVFDDYGFPTCPGARKAVDEFFRNKPETPIILGTGQALAIRLASG